MEIIYDPKIFPEEEFEIWAELVQECLDENGNVNRKISKITIDELAKLLYT
jgi:hypothetical protein